MDQQLFEKLAEVLRNRIVEFESLYQVRPNFEQISNESDEIIKKVVLDRNMKFEVVDKLRLLKLITDDYDVQIGEPLVAINDPNRIRWFDAKKHEIDWKHWNAYKKMLSMQGRSEAVIDEAEKVIDTALDFSGDPSDVKPWARKGLIMGNVQSGKTQNFLGLINKSIDTG